MRRANEYACVNCGETVIDGYAFVQMNDGRTGILCANCKPRKPDNNRTPETKSEPTAGLEPATYGLRMPSGEREISMPTERLRARRGAQARLLLVQVAGTPEG